jgi:hypothetical protein
MKRRTILPAIAVVLLLGRVALGGITWTVNPGDSIQAAIGMAAPGDSIHVVAGTYAENININKAVDVIGLGGWSATRIVGIANVGAGALLQGFRVGTADQGAFIDGNGATIDGCWIESTGTSATTHTVQIYPGAGAANVTIRNSTIRTNTAGKAAIYVETYALLDGFLLDHNDIIGDYGVTQSFGALNTTISNNSFTGMAGSTNRGIQIKTSMDNVRIENNTITGFAVGVRLDTSLAEIGTGPVIVTGNTISDNSVENLMIKRVPNLQVTWNELSQSSAVPNIHIYSGQSDLDVDYIWNNNILGAIGVQNDTTTDVNANFNWWGDPSGPTHNGNPGGIGASVTDYVSYGGFLSQPISGSGPSAVPEPGTLGLLALGALTAGAAGWIRRRRSGRNGRDVIPKNPCPENNNERRQRMDEAQ